MASSSPSQSYIFFQTPGWHLQAHLRQKSLLQLGQISWYSSVQSSSTFRYRLAHKPLYIFRFKKIEQGQLSYPKICPQYSNNFKIGFFYKILRSFTLTS